MGFFAKLFRAWRREPARFHPEVEVLEPRLTPALIASQAALNTASGTIVIARWSRFDVDIAVAPLVVLHAMMPPPDTAYTSQRGPAPCVRLWQPRSSSLP